MGHFKNSVLHGQGKFIQPDGTITQGEFRKGKLCGKALITQANGEERSGLKKEWKQQNKSKGLGQALLPDGELRQGREHHDSFNRNGYIQMPSGNVEDGHPGESKTHAVGKNQQRPGNTI